MRRRNRAAASIAILALFTASCAKPESSRLWTWESGRKVIERFPHNCLERKTTLDAEETNDSLLKKDPEWIAFKSIVQKGDELWFWEDAVPVPNPNDYPHGANTMGVCILRNNKVHAVFMIGVLTVVQ